MRRPHKLSVRLVLILAAILFVAGGLSGCKSLSPAEATKAAGVEVRSLIRQNVEDQATAGKMIGLVDALESDMKAFDKKRAALNQELVETNARYDSSRSEMKKLYTVLNQESKAMANRIVKFHFDLKKLATAEEWKKISMPKHRIGGI